MNTSVVRREKKDVYFVWTRTGHRPHFAHKSCGRAVAEAQRLATLNPGKKFIVMRCLGKYSVASECVNATHEGDLRASERAKLAVAEALVNELNGSAK